MDFVTVEALSELASLAYDRDGNLFASVHNKLPDWKVVELTPGAGFGIQKVLSEEYFVAENTTTHELALVFRGTEPPTWSFDFVGPILGDVGTDLLNLGDILADVGLFVGGGAGVALPLTGIVNLAKKYALDNHDTMFVSGHSLGGAIAEALFAGMHDGVLTGGLGVASPSVDPIDSSLNFVHVTRNNDVVGMYDPFVDGPILIATNQLILTDTDHVGQRIEIRDDNVANGDLGAAHNDLSYAARLAVIGSVYGNIQDDYPLIRAWFGGSDADYLNSDGDYDTLIGGSGSDFYSLGIGPAHITIYDDDLSSGNNASVDTIRFYSGSFFSHIDYSWFHLSPDGKDLLIQAPAPDGTLALDIDIKNMGTAAGQIEHFDLYPGAGTGPPVQSWALAPIWAALTASPAVQPIAPSVPTLTPPSGGSTGDFTWIGTAGSDTWTGGPGHNVASGGAGFDTMTGGSGDDILFGGSGLGNGPYYIVEGDILNGGDGNDILVDDDPNGPYDSDILNGGAGNDVLVFYGPNGFMPDTGDGGSGDDLAMLELSRLTVPVNAGPGQYVQYTVSYTDTSGSPYGGNFSINLTNIERYAIYSGSGNDNLTGGANADYIDGGAGNDWINGNGGNDTLIGGAGDDTITAGLGVSWIDGGPGTDSLTLDKSDATTGLTFDLAAASTDAGYTMADGTFVKNIERLTLTTGSGDDQVWISGAGTDYISTGAGNDQVTFSNLTGGRYTWDGGDGTDRVTLDLSNIADAIRAGADQYGNYSVTWGDHPWYVSSPNEIDLPHVESFAITGGSGNDNLSGGTSADYLNGGAGNDYLYGNGGNDTLVGGDGDDTIIAGLGVSWIDGGAGNDTLTLDKSDATTGLTFDLAAASTDAGYTMADGTFVKNIEHVSLTTGSGDDQVSISGAGSDYISTGAGNDQVIFSNLTGGRYTWDGGDGTDRVTLDLSNIADAIRAGADQYGNYSVTWGDHPWYVSSPNEIDLPHVESFAITGGSGNDNLSGGTSNDYLNGGAGNDTLIGNGGNDTLIGGAGQDKLIGGDGADTFVYLAASDSTAAAPDTITDFQTGVDTIDLSALSPLSESIAVSGGVYVLTVQTANGPLVVNSLQPIALSDLTLLSPAYVNQQITALYDAYIGRDPMPSETSSWTQALTSGGYTLDTMKSALIGAEVTTQYDAYIGRDATPAETAAWAQALTNGAYTIDTMRSALIGAEIPIQYDTCVGRDPTASETSSWSQALTSGAYSINTMRSALIGAEVQYQYDTYIGRDPTSAETNGWTQALTSGADTIGTMKSALIGAEVTVQYDTYIGRDPTPTETSGWSQALTSGAYTIGTMKSALIGAEITFQYDTYIGRDPTAGETANWSQALQNGTALSDFHHALVTTAQGQAQTTATVTSLYESWLGRDPNSSEASSWAGAVANGTSYDQIRDALEHAPESANTGVQHLYGTTGADAFAFPTGWSRGVIDTFDPLQDALALSGSAYGGINPLDGAHAREIAEFDGSTDVLITLDPTHAVLLGHVHLASLHASNFSYI